MELSVIAPPLGVVIAAAISASTIWLSKRSNEHADHAATVDTPTGMAGLIIAGWRELVEQGRIREAEGYAREAQLRVDLDACIERARRRRTRPTAKEPPTP